MGTAELMDGVTEEARELLRARARLVELQAALFGAEQVYRDAEEAFCRRHGEDPAFPESEDRGTNLLFPNGLLVQFVGENWWEEPQGKRLEFRRPVKLGE